MQLFSTKNSQARTTASALVAIIQVSTDLYRSVYGNSSLYGQIKLPSVCLDSVNFSAAFPTKLIYKAEKNHQVL